MALGQYGGGLFFVTIEKKKSLEEAKHPEFELVQNLEEVYFKNHGVCCVVEIRKGLMIVCVQGN
jgi:hypothetical protein